MTVISDPEVTSRAKCAALLKHGTVWTDHFFDRDEVTSRAKCAALLKLIRLVGL